MHKAFMINTCCIINIEEKNNNNLSLHFCLNITEQRYKLVIIFTFIFVFYIIKIKYNENKLLEIR